ncbi:PP2C family protein-serine/threonine phosphatase [Marinobacter sp.]|uniref:PP2C family protein-serine/threonine phosphatase n=1 Tax=Marinobacter sp. TaxID=50741 RepID=UPI00384F9AC4
MMKLQAAGITHTGARRSTNQDAIAWQVSADGTRAFAAVADGMGGYEGGEIASRLTIEAVTELLEPALDGSEPGLRNASKLLQQAITVAGERLDAAKHEDPELARMGTTVVLAWLQGSEALVAHLGDSRCYHLSGEGLELKTRDDTVVQNMVDDGSITPAEAPRVPFRNVLTRALGSSKDVTATFGEFQLDPGDRLLLCSDGLPEAVPEDEWLDIMAGGESLQDQARRLIDASLDKRATDNVSVVLVQALWPA